MTLKLTETSDGTLLPVRVTPRASRTQIDGVQEGSIRVKLKAPPVDGAANRALCEFLSSVLDCRKRDVAVVKGERGREKLVLVRSLSPDDVRRMLDQP
jgi:uncharacterized protein